MGLSLKGAMNSVKNAVVSTGNKVLEKVEDTYDDVNDETKEVLTDTVDISQEAMEQGTQYTKDLATDVVETAVEKVENAIDDTQKIAATVEKTVSDTAEATVSTGSKVVDKVEDTYNDVKDETKEVFTDTVETVVEKVENAIDDTQKTAATVEVIISDTAETTSKALSEISKKADYLSSIMQKNFAIKNNSVTLSMGSMNKIVGGAAEFANTVNETLDQGISITKGTLNEVKEGVEHIKNEWNNVDAGTKKDVHLALDIAGFIPVGGEAFDAVNGTLYLLEGDYAQAGLSFASMIPGADVATKGGRYAKYAKGLGALDKTLDVISAIGIATDVMGRGLDSMKKEDISVSEVPEGVANFIKNKSPFSQPVFYNNNLYANESANQINPKFIHLFA